MQGRPDVKRVRVLGSLRKFLTWQNCTGKLKLRERLKMPLRFDKSRPFIASDGWHLRLSSGILRTSMTLRKTAMLRLLTKIRIVLPEISPIGVIMIIRVTTLTGVSRAVEIGGSETIAKGLTATIGRPVPAAARPHVTMTALGTIGDRVGMITVGIILILPHSRRRRHRGSGRDNWVQTMLTCRDARLPHLPMLGTIGADDT